MCSSCVEHFTHSEGFWLLHGKIEAISHSLSFSNHESRLFFTSWDPPREALQKISSLINLNCNCCATVSFRWVRYSLRLWQSDSSSTWRNFHGCLKTLFRHSIDCVMRDEASVTDSPASRSPFIYHRFSAESAQSCARRTRHKKMCIQKNITLSCCRALNSEIDKNHCKVSRWVEEKKVCGCFD